MKPMLNVSRQNAESSIACSWELHARTTSYQSPFSGFSGLDMSRESPILLTVLSSLTDCADYGASSQMHLKICCCIVEPVEAFRCLPPQPSSLGLHLPKEHISSVFLRCPFLLPQITTSPALCIFHTKSEATCMLKALPRFARASCGNYFVDPFFEVSHIITHLGNGITIRYNTILHYSPITDSIWFHLHVFLVFLGQLMQQITTWTAHLRSLHCRLFAFHNLASVVRRVRRFCRKV